MKYTIQVRLILQSLWVISDNEIYYRIVFLLWRNHSWQKCVFERLVMQIYCNIPRWRVDANDGPLSNSRMFTLFAEICSQLALTTATIRRGVSHESRRRALFKSSCCRVCSSPARNRAARKRAELEEFSDRSLVWQPIIPLRPREQGRRREGRTGSKGDRLGNVILRIN